MRVVLSKLARFPLALALLAGCSPEPAPAPTTPAPAAPSGPVLGPGEVAFSSGSEQVVAYLARPKGQGPFPDLAAAFAYLKTSPEVKPDRIGSIGWCMGGGYSIKLAVAEPTLAACAVYYGPLPTERESLAAIKAPVLGFFGDKDEGIPEASVLAFDTAMRELGRPVEVHVYRNAGHAFANRDGKNFHSLAADDAWGQLKAFF